MHSSRDLEEVLKNKKCFKLVCGAGNENLEEVEKLVYLYSKAGCNIFDVSANVEVIKSAKKGLERAGIKEDRFISVSVGIKGDPHVNKAFIDNKICKKCGTCEKYCLQNAIKDGMVDEKKCIGCSKCLPYCPINAISIKNFSTDLNKIIPKIIEEGVDCIEFHAITDDEKEVEEKWQILNNNFDGILSICIDRAKLSNEKVFKRLQKMLSKRKVYTTIIQTDGSPMSGGVDDFRTTLQAVATAELILKQNFPVYILLSGGTNSKTKKLADLCELDINGVAIGSYARKIVKDYLCDKMSEAEALKIAENLVKSVY